MSEMEFEIEFIPVDEINNQRKKPKQKRTFWGWVKMIFKLICLSPFLLLFAILFLLFTFKVDGFKYLKNMVVFSFNTDPEIAKQRLTELRNNIQYARRNR